MKLTTSKHTLIKHLTLEQDKSGAFWGYTSLHHYNFSDATNSPTSFITSLVLSSLEQLHTDKNIQKIRVKAMQYLLGQKSSTWSFNYWDRSSTPFVKTPYPDDLDDTFCALSAIYSTDKKKIDGNVLAHIISLLTANESTVGGPYYTWIMPSAARNSWNNIDLAVNSNIAYFLMQHNISLPNLITFVEKAIVQKKYQSDFYASSISVMYFIGRWYKGPYASLLAVHVEQALKNLSQKDSLHRAMAISTLLRLKPTSSLIKPNFESLRAIINQKKLQPTGLYIERIEKKHTFYTGSYALTYAVCLEAISLYEAKKVFALKKSPYIKSEQNMLVLVEHIVQKKLSVLPRKLRSSVQQALTLINKDRRISLLPFYFAQALQKNTLSKKLIAELGAVNIFGWAAYKIYDDILDNEAKPHLLPVANICFKEVIQSYMTLLTTPETQVFFHRVLTTIESANMWEHVHGYIDTTQKISLLQLPKYTNHEILAQKSLGHALGPLTILFKNNYTSTSREVTATYTFFVHYLVARQLHDDAHDWLADLQRGFVNSVGAMILNQIKSESKFNQQSVVSLQTYKQLERLFWHEIIQKVTTHIIKHITKARQELKKLTVLKDSTYFESLLQPLELSAQKTLHERDAMLSFLKHYGKAH